jgi:hypothetical protein
MRFDFLRAGDWLTKHARVVVCMLVVVLVRPGEYGRAAAAAITFSNAPYRRYRHR